MFSLFRKKDKGAEFWDWFAANKSHLEKFIDNIAAEKRDYTYLEKCTKKLKEFHPQLFS